MKVNPIILGALSLFSGTTWAQSSVVLYGVADMSLEYASRVGTVPLASNGFNSGAGKSVYRMDSGGLSGSRWGIRGTEDIGGGLQSVFVLESGVSMDNGNQMQGRLFGRQAFVGLQSSSLGKFTFGRQYTSLFDSIANFSPTIYATQYSPTVLLLGAAYREDNTAKYSGVFGPFVVGAHWSFGTGLALPATAASTSPLTGTGEVPGQFRRDSAYGVGVNYFAGGLGAALAFDEFNPSMVNGTGGFKKLAIAGSYAAGPAKLMAGYRWGKNNDGAGNEILRDDFYWIGANYKMTGNVDLTFEYAYDKIHRIVSESKLGNPWQVTVIANYSFSKRTSAYVATSFAKNAGLNLDNAAINYANSLGTGNSYALGAGETSMVGVGLGIRHTF
ncbi:porin [Cupriavidus basilensis]|uniref:Outer membrane protein (Porin) n=1 Tax=Cupriavidus basilensis TaxID=68895 RepID=A0A0C4YCN2_9BURK|nr:porin [Cupriavidus basilensis]AJG23372.1 Outer membrane protein (porin) [Cupriavidus basilensis]